MLKSLSTSFIVRGILAVAVGIVALAWPGVTVLALVILFAIYAFISAGMEAVKAFSSERAGPVIGHLLLGLVDVGAGVIALAWPGPTALVLVLLVGAWAMAAGLVEIYTGFKVGEKAGTRALFFVSGLISIAFGIVLFARPGVGLARCPLISREDDPGVRGAIKIAVRPLRGNRTGCRGTRTRRTGSFRLTIRYVCRRFRLGGSTYWIIDRFG